MELKEAARIIQEGGIVAFPTETVYGLGANALEDAAVRKIFAAKGRPSDNPLIVHISDMEMLSQVAHDLPQEARILAERFWPGPLTIVVPKNERVAPAVSVLDTVAVRMPAHPIALALIEEAGVPIAAPSANRSGSPSPTSAANVRADFPILPILDGGSCEHGLESSVVALDPPRLLRPGAITLEQLREILAGIEPVSGNLERPASPGMKYKHYAPSRPLRLFDTLDEMAAYAQEHPDAIALCMDQHMSRFDCTTIPLGKTVAEMAARLYDALRSDEEGSELIVHAVPREGVGLAVMDRLERAAGHNPNL